MTARAFAARGADVVVCGRSEERGRQALRELSDPGNVGFIAADVTVEQDVVDLIGQVVDRHGRLDFAFSTTDSGSTTDPDILPPRYRRWFAARSVRG